MLPLCPALPLSAPLRLPISPPSPPLLRIKRSNTIRASSQMDRRTRISSLFPPLPHREVALELVSAVESRLEAQLLPSSVPDNVLSFQNNAGTSLGSIDIRYGSPGSSVDFILESWLHCKLSNGSIDITSLLAFLNDSTDSPHLIMDLIQGSPTSIILLLDLLPRRDLSLNPDYIDKFYTNTNLDKQRHELEKLPQVVPYRSPSLYVRSILSPTAVAVAVNCGQGGESEIEGIVNGSLASVAREVVRVWLDECAGTSKEMEERERDYMMKRDRIVKSKSIEIDLAANLPRLFDPDVSNRVVGEIQKAFRVEDRES